MEVGPNEPTEPVAGVGWGEIGGVWSAVRAPALTPSVFGHPPP